MERLVFIRPSHVATPERAPSRNPSLELRLRLRRPVIVARFQDDKGYVGQVGTSIGLTHRVEADPFISLVKRLGRSGASPHQARASLA